MNYNAFNSKNKQKSVAELKGFVFGVNWHNHLDKVQELLKKIKPFSAVTWDGDLYKHNSFTFILQLIMNEYPNKKYIAFKKEKGLKKLKSNYFEYNTGVPSRGFSQQIKAVKMNNKIKFDNMGIQAIQILQRKFKKVHIFFLGQGYVAAQEEKKIKSAKMLFPDVEITKLNITRKIPTKPFNKVKFKSQLTSFKKKHNNKLTQSAQKSVYPKYSTRRQNLYFGPNMRSLTAKLSKV